MLDGEYVCRYAGTLCVSWASATSSPGLNHFAWPKHAVYFLEIADDSHEVTTSRELS